MFSFPTRWQLSSLSHDPGMCSVKYQLIQRLIKSATFNQRETSDNKMLQWGQDVLFQILFIDKGVCDYNDSDNKLSIYDTHSTYNIKVPTND